jgi:hypothetical protein
LSASFREAGTSGLSLSVSSKLSKPPDSNFSTGVNRVSSTDDCRKLGSSRRRLSESSLPPSVTLRPRGRNRPTEGMGAFPGRLEKSAEYNALLFGGHV